LAKLVRDVHFIVKGNEIYHLPTTGRPEGESK
jgi:hypothetical protein